MIVMVVGMTTTSMVTITMMEVMMMMEMMMEVMIIMMIDVTMMLVADCQSLVGQTRRKSTRRRKYSPKVVRRGGEGAEENVSLAHFFHFALFLNSMFPSRTSTPVKTLKQRAKFVMRRKQR